MLFSSPRILAASKLDHQVDCRRVEVSSGLTANLTVEMRIGAVEETITVPGQSSLFGEQNTRQRTVMSREVIAATAGNGLTAQDAGFAPNAS
jgi:hypothetical protein